MVWAPHLLSLCRLDSAWYGVGSAIRQFIRLAAAWYPHQRRRHAFSVLVTAVDIYAFRIKLAVNLRKTGWDRIKVMATAVRQSADSHL
jgi:hypothetical protein